MQRQMRPDGLETNLRTLRSPSISSDVMSNSARSIGSAVPHANPSPAYIAQAAASSLISAELDRTVLVSSPALTLVNEFLDHVLFTILSTSRSVSLTSLRAAVPSVLKPRLGKAAVRVAEEELKEYLEEEEEAEFIARKGMTDSKQEFDVELAWKWARLRCMVYTRLGDLEEEDEDEWLEKEQLIEQVNASGRLKQGDIEMGPASAIFLTTVVEFLGEQALYYAAQHAQRRSNFVGTLGHKQSEDSAATLTPKTDEIILDGKDMNHVGRDSPLSRLWRSWRRNTREMDSRPMSPDSVLSPLTDFSAHSRTTSQANASLTSTANKSVHNHVQSPGRIPLPLTENDVDEIEVPGLASALSESEDEAPEIPDRSKRRPVSMVVMPGTFPDVADAPDPYGDDLTAPTQSRQRPEYTRKRSVSSPAPVTGSLFTLGTNTKGIDEQIVPAEEQAIKSDELKEVAATTPLVHRRERSSVADQGSANKRAGMVGGAIAAAVGALGAGAAAAAAAVKGDDEDDRNDRVLEATRKLSTAIGAQKRTVAEEMLGPGSSVPPPKDATTGASITNFADFDSMHIPMEMPPESPPLTERNTVPPSMDPIVTNDRSPPMGHAVTTSADNAIHEDSHPQELAEPRQAAQRNQSLPMRSVTAEQSSSSGLKPLLLAKSAGIAHDRKFNQNTSEKITTTTLLSTPAYHGSGSPVSPMPSTDSRPLSSGSDLSGTSETTVPARQTALASNPVRHMHADSQGSAHSHHSKSSSSSSRLLGFTRDAHGRPQTISQQHASGGMSDDTRAAHSSTPNNLSYDGRPGTAPSSPVKVANKGMKHNDEGDEAKKKSLEVLIQSNETLHYTLTPATAMKDEDSYMATKHRTETQDMADFLRNTGPPISNAPAVVRGPTVPFSNQNAELHTINTQRGQQRVPPVHTNFSQPLTSPGRTRNPLGEPRGPRAEKSTAIHDLADYARSTGPVDDSQLPRALSPRPPASETPFRAVAQPKPTPKPNSKPTNRLKFQARDPRISRYAESSDLIDFIREGPPRKPGEHRIDRKVAPFRTTMDSDDLNNLASHMDQDSSAKTSEASTHDRRSEGPSISSQTALLAHNRATNGNVNGVKTVNAKMNAAADDDGMPQRKRTRVKDPYAIDYSDGEEDGEQELAGGHEKTNEESLIDFLRNTAPPPGATTQPIIPAQASASKPITSSKRLAEGSKTTTARETSPHLTQTGSKIDTYKPTQSTYAPHVEKARTKPKFEARDPIAVRTETSDLAEYLKNSGPPPSSQMQPQPFILSNNTINSHVQSAGPDKDPGLLRMFTKRKAK